MCTTTSANRRDAGDPLHQDIGSGASLHRGGRGHPAAVEPRISSDFTLGTAFQFADMTGVGLQFGNRQRYLAGYRFQHISNGGINEPNPGINFSQLYLQYNF